MMRKVAFFLFFVMVIFSFSQSYSQQVAAEMKVLRISDNLLVADKGSVQGVQKDSIYEIHKQKKVIGQAKALLVKDNLCGLKIIKLEPGYKIQPKDQLTLSIVKNSKKKDEGGYIFRMLKYRYCLVSQDLIIQN